MSKDKILRIQADKLAELLGLKPGTYLVRSMIKRIAEAKCGDEIDIDGTTVKVTPSAIGLANVILTKV